MFDAALDLRKFAPWLVSGVLVLGLLLAGLWVWRYLTTGTITVSASGSQTIVTIAGVSDDNGNFKNTDVRQAANHLTVRVGVGDYIVSAQGHVATINRTITLHRRQHVTETFSLPRITSPEDVANADASDLAIGDSSLYYLDQESSALRQIDTNNAVNNVSGNVQLSSIQWADASYGVGQGLDDRLYLINGNPPVAISLPPGANSTNVHYALSPARQLYVSVGRDLYAQNASGTGFARIYTAASVPGALTASAKAVGLLGEPKGGVQNPLLTLLSPTGKLLSSDKVGGDVVAWSADGGKLAISGFEEEGGIEILNGSLHKIALLPSGSAPYVWLNNSTLLYVSQSGLWSYDVTSKDSILIANLPPGEAINEVDLDSHHTFAYLSVTDQDGNSTIERVGLRGQKAASVAYQLSVFFPLDVDECAMDFANFTKPTLNVSVSPDGLAECQQTVLTTLASDEIDPKQLQVNYQLVAGD